MSDNNKLWDKLEKIDSAVCDTRIDIAAIKVDLNYHVKRTDLAEANIEEVRKDSNVRLAKLEKWYANWHFLGWLIAGAFSLFQGYPYVVEFLKKF